MVHLFNKEEVVSLGSSDPGETSFLIIDPRTTEGVGKVIMSEPYECAEGMCRDVVSWSLPGILAAVAITTIAVMVIIRVVEQVRRK
jgi:hypothetical protein